LEAAGHLPPEQMIHSHHPNIAAGVSTNLCDVAITGSGPLGWNPGKA
jgi:hypothetical protein